MFRNESFTYFFLILIYVNIATLTCCSATTPPSLPCSSISFEDGCGLRVDDCIWSNGNTCVNVLACRLEGTQASCRTSTRNCEWNSNACTVQGKFVSVEPSFGCSDKLNKSVCLEEKTCTWTLKKKCIKRSNIVFSLSDDLGWYDVGWTNPRSRTPVLNALKNGGVTLTRHYTNRFCAPSRAMLMTGRYAWRYGMQTDLNLDPITSLRCATPKYDGYFMPDFFKTNGGYSTHAFGKWHMGHYMEAFMPTNRGFDTFVGYLAGDTKTMEPDQFRVVRCACKGNPAGPAACAEKTQTICTSAFDMLNTSFGEVFPYQTISLPPQGTEHGDILIAQEVERVILNAAEDPRPLFLYMAWATPHNPVMCPARYRRGLVPQGSPYPWGTDGTIPGCSRAPLVDQRMNFLGMVSLMDEMHSTMVDALDRVSRLGNTIFVFTSDNGGQVPPRDSSRCVRNFGNNYPLRGGKFAWWEGGIRTHAFAVDFSKFGRLPQSTYEGLVSITDWRATLAGAVGLSDPFAGNLGDSLNLWSAMTGSKNLLEGSAVIERLDLPAQYWEEARRYVILFQFEGKLWKYMNGYPYKGQNSGMNAVTALTLRARFSLSNIQQPLEMPKSEYTVKPQAGIGSQYNCMGGCLINLTDDPSELHVIPTGLDKVGARRRGEEIANSLHSQYIPVLQSTLCQPAFYSSNLLQVTDEQSIRTMVSCGVVGPWIAENEVSALLC